MSSQARKASGESLLGASARKRRPNESGEVAERAQAGHFKSKEALNVLQTYMASATG